MTIPELPDDLLANWKVLIVDDEPDCIEVAQLLLEMCGATVHSAGNGKDGLALAQTLHPDVILSDLSMPEMSGWHMLRALKTNLTTKDIPVIALTAHAMKGDRELAFGAGFHNFLTKPLTPETFVREMLNLLLDVDSLRELLEKANYGLYN